jgi:hypothetical protein
MHAVNNPGVRRYDLQIRFEYSNSRPASVRLFLFYSYKVGPNEGVTRRQLEEDRSLALWDFLQSRSDAPLRLGHVRAAILQLALDPLLGDPGLGLGRKAVDVGQGRPFHLGANCTLYSKCSRDTPFNFPQCSRQAPKKRKHEISSSD